ncbi:hypothetical protein TWF192_002815 [Orbilia oligospora]|uniref:Uncharacterized protein n=1 Tax=Orbilia oligospora TaxID=2813651 RepID=A0A6G1LRQ6_ORBOL|nr:hypothetical protein TWF191_000685 [Orbilia oligospora]KAF3232837.1 hypothetical protein TWF192_002815 [Orbilia oligospora]
MKNGRSSCPNSRTGTPSGARGIQRAPRNSSSPPKNDTHQDERPRSRGYISSSLYEEKSSISMNDSPPHPGKRSKEVDSIIENLTSHYVPRSRRSREFGRENNPSRLIHYTLPFDSSKRTESSPLPASQNSLVFTSPAIKDSKHVKKQKGNSFKSNGEFLTKTLDGMERWLLKSESSFSAGDLAALSSEKEGLEEESPLEQLLNCALQIYHWGRTHGDSDAIVWKDHPSDVRKAFNSAILELGSSNSGKPNYKSQDELILRMRYNPSRLYSGSQPKDGIQDICIQEYTTSKESASYTAPLKSRNLLNPLVGDGATANPYTRLAEGKLLSSSNELLVPSLSSNVKSGGGKFWDLLNSLESSLDPKSPLRWYQNAIQGKSKEDENSISSRSSPQAFESTLYRAKASPRITDSMDLSAKGFLSCPSFDSVSGIPCSKASTQGPVFARSCPAQYSPGYHSSDNLHENDDDEELGKLSASLLYLVYLGLTYERGSDSRSGTGGEPTGGSTSGYSSAPGGSGNSPGNLPASKSRQMNRTKKHGRGDSDDDDGGKGSEPPKRKKKLMSAQEINQRLACPFAKGDPTTHERCLFVHRRDLPGVREHLKRNHFGGTVPPEIRQARTWSQIFLVCNPNWPNHCPIPSPHLDVSHIHPSRQTNTISPGTFAPSTSAVFTSIGDRSRSIAAVAPMRTLTQRIFPSSPTCTQAPVTLSSLAIGVDESLENSQNPFFMQTPAPQIRDLERTESLLPSSTTQSSIDNLLGFDNLNEFFQDSIEWLKANTITNTYTQSMPDRRPSPHEFLGRASTGSSFSDAPVQILTPRSSLESLSDALVQDSEFDQWFKFPTSYTPTSTPPVTIHRSNRGREGKYLLRVARKPALPKGTSSETSSSKKFYFDNMEEFKANFENWMKTQFYDPEFCWGLWELENPGRQERLSDMQAVVDELEFMLLAYRSNEAALFLVGKLLYLD